jgi:hypothetical protein
VNFSKPEIFDKQIEEKEKELISDSEQYASVYHTLANTSSAFKTLIPSDIGITIKS